MPIRPILEEVDFDRISEDLSTWLEKPFLEEKILVALNSMEDDKALGLDGFLTKFLKVCWEIVRKEVMAMFTEFHSKDCWFKSSASFVTLIPKKSRAFELKDFRLISLVGCMYTLLAKTLAIWFKASFRESSLTHNTFFYRVDR